MRWFFTLLLLANLFPPLFAANSSLQLRENREPSLPAFSGVGRIVLLSEVDQSADERRVENPVSATCLVVGPLGSMDQVLKLEQRIGEAGFLPLRKSRQLESGADYWVFLQAQPSSRATTRLLQELRANGIDSFVVAEGELEGAIGVGIYSDQQSAEARLSRLEGLGYSVGIHEMQRWIKQYWVLVENDKPSVSWGVLKDRLKEQSTPQKIYSSSCQTVASAQGFQ